MTVAQGVRPNSTTHEATQEIPETIIRPRSGWISVDWREMVRNRELLYFLVWRDIVIRYKQTVLGVAWAVVQPLFTMVVFTLIFSKIAKLPSQGVPYPVFVLLGQTLWALFATGVSGAGASLISQQHLLTKVYFPRLFVPTSAVGTAVVDFFIGLALLAVVMPYYGVLPSVQTPAMIPLLGLVLMATLGVGFAAAALTVVYRDFRYLVTFGLQIFLYLSPVIYPPESLPIRYHLILSINPMFGLIDGCRSALLGTPWHPESLAISSTMAVLLFFFGTFYFRRVERRFADIA